MFELISTIQMQLQDYRYRHKCGCFVIIITRTTHHLYLFLFDFQFVQHATVINYSPGITLFPANGYRDPPLPVFTGASPSKARKIRISQFYIKHCLYALYASNYSQSSEWCVNSSRPRQNGRHFPKIFSNAFSWMKMFEFRLRFNLSLFPRFQ